MNEKPFEFTKRIITKNIHVLRAQRTREVGEAGTDWLHLLPAVYTGFY